ncbi:MAG: hypothetical protein M0Q41_07930 [Bacteroidales bacterium]|jgi:hypothetical protein|nr:hypothetical protein [Bacteroidales bacterium]
MKSMKILRKNLELQLMAFYEAVMKYLLIHNEKIWLQLHKASGIIYWPVYIVFYWRIGLCAAISTVHSAMKCVLLHPYFQT